MHVDLATGLYVDAYVSGSDYPASAIDEIVKAHGIWGEIGMELRTWSSNSRQDMDFSERDLDMEMESSPCVLGVTWITEVDVLSCRSVHWVSCTEVTKRRSS